MAKRIITVLLVLIVLSLSGCPLVAGTIQSVSDIGLTEGDRGRLLTEAVKKYNDNLFWRQSQRVLALATPEGRDDVLKEIRFFGEERKLVENKVLAIDIDPSDSHKSTVSVRTKYYNVGEYIVRDRTVDQIWHFSLSDGWKIASINER